MRHQGLLLIPIPVMVINSYMQGQKISCLKYPSQNSLLIDDYYTKNTDRGYYTVAHIFLTSSSTGGVVDGRHSGNANVLFVDGHAKSIVTGRNISNSVYSSSNNPYLTPPFGWRYLKQ